MNRFIHFALAIGTAICFSSVSATEVNLEGLWFETDNYPASSVLRFEKLGAGWVGKYAKVSSQQRAFGFTVGETVIRGVVKERVFSGQVLLKSTSSQFSCPELTTGWVPIKMSLVGSDKLQGAWLQSWVDYERACALLRQSWQPYRLEKLPQG